MDINLEKIELVKERTGSTYAEAKEALEKAEGSVVDAIIDIEEKVNEEFEAAAGAIMKDSPIFEKIKTIVDKGNVTKIMIKKGDKTIVSFPVTAGVIGTVLVPWGAVLGVVAALGTKCEILFLDVDGNTIDLNGKVVTAYEQAKDAAMKGLDFVSEKAQSVIGDVTKEGGKLDETLDKVEDFAYKTSDKLQELSDKVGSNPTLEDLKKAFETGSSKLIEVWDKLEKSGKIDDVKEAVDRVSKRAVETAKNLAKEASDIAEKADADFKADAEEAADEEFSNEEL